MTAPSADTWAELWSTQVEDPPRSHDAPPNQMRDEPVKGIGSVKTVHCPSCREQHLAGADAPGWLWFTCEGRRFELPDTQARLGSDAYIAAREAGLYDETGCMNCGRTAMCTDPDTEELIRYVCHRCGEVGVYLATLRSNWKPCYDLFAADVGEPVRPREPSCIEAPEESPPWKLGVRHRWRKLTAWAEGGY